jgi:hypothetical protein
MLTDEIPTEGEQVNTASRGMSAVRYWHYPLSDPQRTSRLERFSNGLV